MVEKDKLSPVGRDIAESLEDVIAYLKGDKSRATETVIDVGTKKDCEVADKDKRGGT